MSEEKIITNDLYCAAYLLTEGCTLEQYGRNSRRRISFVLSGENVKALREKYKTENVNINVKRYRDKIRYVRQLMDEIKGAKVCPNNIQKTD